MTHLYWLFLTIWFNIGEARPDQVAGFEYEEELLYDTFPNGFVWGAATSAYQVKYRHSSQRMLI